MLAGSMAADVGRHSLAQRYYIQTLNLSMSAGDRLYAANVLSHMSRMTVQIGNVAATDEDRARNARQAIALARAGQGVAQGKATPALNALLHAVEARGHALLGDSQASRKNVLEAERQYERSEAAAEPSWLSFYTSAELAADLGRCLRDTGDPERGTALITRALDEYEPWRVRSRCFVQPTSPRRTSFAAIKNRPPAWGVMHCVPRQTSAPLAPSTSCAPCTEACGRSAANHGT